MHLRTNNKVSDRLGFPTATVYGRPVVATEGVYLLGGERQFAQSAQVAVPGVVGFPLALADQLPEGVDLVQERGGRDVHVTAERAQEPTAQLPGGTQGEQRNASVSSGPFHGHNEHHSTHVPSGLHTVV